MVKKLLCSLLALCLAALWAVSGIMNATAQGSYKQRVINTRPNALLAYWSLEETSGSTAHDFSGNARHGALCGGSSAPALNSTYFADGASPAPRFDGNDCVNAFSSSFASAFTGNEGTIMLWIKAFTGTVWSDSTFRRLFWAYQGGSNLFSVQHLNAATDLIRIGGGVDKRGTTNLSGTGWIPLFITYSTTANEARYYAHGVLLTTQSAIGTFSGAISELLIGAGDTSGSFGWNGFIGHVAIWNQALTGVEIASLSVMDTSVLTPPPIGFTDTPTPSITPSPTPDLLRYLPVGSGYGAVALTITGGEALNALLIVILIVIALVGFIVRIAADD